MIPKIVLQLLLGSLAVAQHILVEVGQPGTLLLSVGNATVEIVVKEAKNNSGLTFFNGLVCSIGVSSILAFLFIISSATLRQQVLNFFTKPALYATLLKKQQPPRKQNAYVDTTHFTLGTDKFMIMKTPAEQKYSESDENIYDYIDDNLVGRNYI